MDVVLIFNGLGNQMSQYAFYLAKKKQDPRTKCLYFPEPGTCQHNGYELDRLFGVKMKNRPDTFLGRFFSWYNWSQVCDSRKRHWLRVIMKHLHVSLKREPSYAADPEMLNSVEHGVRFLYGGWHCEDNFKSVENEVRNLYSFDDNLLNDKGCEILKQIESENSVSVHVRRGDFLTDGFGGICTKEYYDSALAYMNSHVGNPHYFVFSDDMEWSRENLKCENVTFVDIHHGKDSWKDMMLMSRCKHNINANSTFSWWGAWLNENKGKIVVVPERFSQRLDSGAIYPKEWIRIK